MMDCAPVKLQLLANCNDGDIGQGSDGTQKSKVVVHSQCNSLGGVVRPPGFEPGSAPWKGAILDRARLWPRTLKQAVRKMRFKRIVRVNSLNRSVEGLDHICV